MCFLSADVQLQLCQFLPFSPPATKLALEIQRLRLKALFFLKATRDTLTAQLIIFTVLKLLTSSQGRGLTLFPGTSQGQLPQSPPIFPHQQRTDPMLAGACWRLGELVRQEVLFSGKSAGLGLSCGLPTPHWRHTPNSCPQLGLRTHSPTWGRSAFLPPLLHQLRSAALGLCLRVWTGPLDSRNPKWNCLLLSQSITPLLSSFLGRHLHSKLAIFHSPKSKRILTLEDLSLPSPLVPFLGQLFLFHFEISNWSSVLPSLSDVPS